MARDTHKHDTIPYIEPGSHKLIWHTHAVQMQNLTSKHMQYYMITEGSKCPVAGNLQAAISSVDRPVDWYGWTPTSCFLPRKQNLTKGDGVDERNKPIRNRKRAELVMDSDAYNRSTADS